jgi:hypothetical protein
VVQVVVCQVLVLWVVRVAEADILILVVREPQVKEIAVDILCKFLVAVVVVLEDQGLVVLMLVVLWVVLVLFQTFLVLPRIMLAEAAVATEPTQAMVVLAEAETALLQVLAGLLRQTLAEAGAAAVTSQTVVLEVRELLLLGT